MLHLVIRGGGVTFDVGKSTLPSSTNWASLAASDTTVVASSNLSTDKIAYSNDGLTWNLATVPFTAPWNCITYGNGMFVALGATRSIYSYNGKDWYIGTTFTTTKTWRSVTFDGTKFVAIVADRNDTMFAKSTDGITWTLYSTTGVPTDSYRYSIHFDSGIFVLTGQKYIMRSTDGVNWSTMNSPVISESIYADGKWVAVGYEPNINNEYIAYSSNNGNSWTKAPTSTNLLSLTSIAYGNGMFVVIPADEIVNGSYVKPDSLLYSTDGMNWTEYKFSDTRETWTDIIYANGVFIVIGFTTNIYSFVI